MECFQNFGDQAERIFEFVRDTFSSSRFLFLISFYSLYFYSGSVIKLRDWIIRQDYICVCVSQPR